MSDIPVYTAAQNPVAYIKPINSKLPISASKNAPLLSFATNGDGSAGRNFVIHTTPFYLNVDRMVVKIKEPQIQLLYLYAQISNMKTKYGFCHSLKANRQNLKNVSLSVPVSENGVFDNYTQENIANQFLISEQMKKHIMEQREQIRSIIVNINTSDYSMVHKPLSEILNPIKGKSTYTRKYGEVHKGDYPVFSASLSTPLTYIDTYDYDGDFLSWSTNGFAGTVIVLKGRFSINGDRGVLIPKIPEVDILYLRYILEPIFRKLAKGRRGDHGEDEFTKLYPSMIENIDVPLPVDENGEISIKLQKEIASSYLAVEQYKQEIISKLDTILNQQIKY